MSEVHCETEQKRLDDLRTEAYKSLCDYVHINCYEHWKEIMRLVSKVSDAKFATTFYSRFGEAANE